MLEYSGGVAATALDLQQQIDSVLGWAVIDGLQVSPSSEGNYTVTVGEGEALCDGAPDSRAESTITLEQPDDEFPRRDVIYLNASHNLRIQRGAPNPQRPDPSEEGVTADRFECWSPWPHSMHDVNGTVLAEVWVDPAESEITAADIRQRQVDAGHQVNSLSAQQATVTDAPTESNDVARLADLGSGGGGGGGDLTSTLDANGHDIINVGDLDAQTMLMASVGPGNDAVVNRGFVSRYYRKGGDTLTGEMNANDNNIINAGEVQGNIVDAGGELYLPVHDSEPSGGMLWFRSDL
jgi:hypothetical protein